MGQCRETLPDGTVLTGLQHFCLVLPLCKYLGEALCVSLCANMCMSVHTHGEETSCCRYLEITELWIWGLNTSFIIYVLLSRQH